MSLVLISGSAGNFKRSWEGSGPVKHVPLRAGIRAGGHEPDQGLAEHIGGLFDFADHLDGDHGSILSVRDRKLVSDAKIGS